MDDLDLGYLLAVAGAGMWSPRALNVWLSAFGSPRALVEHVRGEAGGRVSSAAEGAFKEDATTRSLERLAPQTRWWLAQIDERAARAALDAARASGARVVLRSDDDYPAQLRDLCDAPPVLYARGDINCLARRTVAIVGSRAATSYGRSVAASLASEFAVFGVTIVSGLARGIDAAAHRGALDAGTPTAAVLGSGVCALYPHYHALLADEIVERGGAVLSEFPPAQCARAFQFPMRNRVVAALAQATIVVEASTRSGALITARLADEFGRAVFAIPGDVGRPTSKGTNALIADGVPLVTSGADVAALMDWECVIGPLAEAAEQSGSLLALLARPRTVDELAACGGGTAAEISAQLLLLELQGAVERRPGGLYAAVATAAAANPRA